MSKTTLIKLATLCVCLFITDGTAIAATLPDGNLTPGKARGLSLSQICKTKWGKDARHVTAAMKRTVFQEYGLTGNTDPFCKPKGCEIDHLISRELGGADDIANPANNDAGYPSGITTHTQCRSKVCCS